jgi:hypothetical protein
MSWSLRGGLADMRDYLIGELSVRLGRIESVAAGRTERDLAQLRHNVENGPFGTLGQATAQAVTLADDLCWQSLACGDVASFARQADIAAELRLFGICARLLGDA